MVKFALAVVTAILSIFTPLNDVKAPADESADYVPVIRFAVMSDSHLNAIGDKKTQRVQKCISLGYDIAAKDENYQNLDAVLFAGDLTDDGRKIQFLGFKSAVDSVLDYGKTELLTVMAKSHDGYCRDNDTFSYFENMTGQPKDFHKVINGFHFIGISASKNKDEHYTEDQREWLKAQLDEAVKDNPSKPVFVMHHEHVSDTVYGSLEDDGWGTDYFKDIFEEYPQIVHFSGHSHYPVNDPRSIWQGKFTAVGTGSLNYAEFTVDGVNRLHPDDYKNMAQMWIVEADAENTVRLRGYDALSGTLLCEYYVNNPADKENRQFTPAQQESATDAPVFSDGAELKVKKLFGKYKVTAPAAQGSENNPVFLYRFYVIDESAEVVSSEYVVNNYWRGEDYETVSVKLSAEKGQTIKVIAENAYGKQSEALEYTV